MLIMTKNILRKLIRLLTLAVFVGGDPSPKDMSLSPLPGYVDENDKVEGINAGAYDDYGLPSDFYHAIYLGDYERNSDVYDNVNVSYLPIVSDAKGCSSVPICPFHQEDPYAPSNGIESDDSDASSKFSREWKCHVETNCVAMDEIPTDIQNDTEILFLQYFNMSILQDNALSSLPPLLKLHIESSDLAILQQGVFKNQESLQYLELPGNLIEKLQPMTFVDLEKLNSLEITDNLLQRLERSIFEGLKSLSVLKLGGNKLNKIENDVFRELGELQELHLDDNNITILSRHAFRGLTKLRALYLGRNYFTKVPNLVLRRLPSLKVLHLTGNPLTHISKADFRHLDKLQELRLDQCDITSISKTAFQDKNMTFLDISSNKLTKLSNFGFIGLKLSMHMAFNPWICNCSLTSATDWIANYSVFIITPKPRCHSPFYMSRRRITDLTKKQLCDATATLPPLKPADEQYWNYFPDDSDTDPSLPEGGWSDEVHDVEKLYPGVYSITPSPQPSATEVDSEKRPTDHDREYKHNERTVETFSRLPATSDVAETTTQFVVPITTAGVRTRRIADHIILVVLILGVSVPMFLIIVLILHTSLHKRSCTEKSDVEMPHIETKGGDENEKLISNKETPDGAIEPHPVSTNDDCAEDETKRHKRPSNNALSMGTGRHSANDEVAQSEHNQMIKAENRTR